MEKVKDISTKQMKVMIVDDNQLLRKTCKDMIKINPIFKKQNLRIISASDGLDVRLFFIFLSSI